MLGCLFFPSFPEIDQDDEISKSGQEFGSKQGRRKLDELKPSNLIAWIAFMLAWIFSVKMFSFHLWTATTTKIPAKQNLPLKSGKTDEQAERVSEHKITTPKHLSPAQRLQLWQAVTGRTEVVLIHPGELTDFFIVIILCHPGLRQIPGRHQGERCSLIRYLMCHLQPVVQESTRVQPTLQTFQGSWNATPAQLVPSGVQTESNFCLNWKKKIPNCVLFKQ